MPIPFKSDKRLIVLSATLLAAYAVRVTIPSVWLYPLVPDLINFSGFVVLIIAAVYLFTQPHKHVNPLSVLLIALLFITTIFSVELDTAIVRAVLWGLIFIVAGPFFMGPQAIAFRELLWDQSKYMILGISILSFLWISLRLPQYGRGASGVTMHCMLLGAIAGLASVVSFSRILALTVRSQLAWGVFIVTSLTCLLGASRSAALAAIAGCVAMAIMRIQSKLLRTISSMGLLFLIVISWYAFNIGDSDIEKIQASEYSRNIYISGLAQKGNINSREQVWSNRIEEFTQNPLVGVGIGVDTFFTTRNAFGAKTIEPGSSYLAVLSMTGIVGAVGLASLLFGFIAQIVKNADLVEKEDLVQMGGIGVFWAVHGVAEGWIYAGGSLLCLLFWIWMGRLANLTQAPAEDESEAI